MTPPMYEWDCPNCGEHISSAWIPKWDDATTLALQEVVDQLDDYGPTGPGFTTAIEHARAALIRVRPA